MMTARWSLLLAASLVAVTATTGIAQDRTQDRTQTKDPSSHTGTPGVGDQDRTRDRDQLKDVLKVDGKLSATEVESVGSDLDGYLKQGGNQEQFRAMVRNSIGEGCSGVCLCEAVRSMNQFMSHGQDATQARASLGNIQREQRQQREQKKLALSDQQKQEQLRQRTMERTREQDRERTRDKAAGSAGGQGGGSGTPQGGGKQGGK
ncbi:MAG: hypothetical protein H6Q88_1407 [Anaeromyxobacteraceae bacterium]|jgi:hypothetical protein|nr:hypothetical protein [Anaeromyxobacteraceae bacterium]